jgi:thioredoxin reductase
LGAYYSAAMTAAREMEAQDVYVVGDVRSGSMKRVAAASGEGASVVPLLHTWLQPEVEH